MLKNELKLTDNVEDSVRDTLKKLDAIQFWSNEKKQRYKTLLKLLKKEKYDIFQGDFRDYHINRKTDWCLYDVPMDQRGFLLKYRGQRVRLICINRWGGYADREFAVKKVPLI